MICHSTCKFKAIQRWLFAYSFSVESKQEKKKKKKKLTGFGTNAQYGGKEILSCRIMIYDIIVVIIINWLKQV